MSAKLSYEAEAREIAEAYSAQVVGLSCTNAILALVDKARQAQAAELHKLVAKWNDFGPAGVKPLVESRDETDKNYLYNNGLADAGCACADELEAALGRK